MDAAIKLAAGGLFTDSVHRLTKWVWAEQIPIVVVVEKPALDLISIAFD